MTVCSYHVTYTFQSDQDVSAPGSAWQACLKNTGVKLELLTDYDMPLMVENGIGGEFVKQHIDMLKQTINI